MPEISFYQVNAAPAEKVGVALLEKVLSTGKRAVLIVKSEARAKEVDDYLWTSPRFLPHGSERDGNQDKQPIFVTHKEVNPNQAEVLVVIDGLTPEYAGTFARVIDIFDGKDAANVRAAEARIAKYKTNGCKVTHHLQNTTGWETLAA